MGFGEIQLHYHIPWTSFKSVVHKEKRIVKSAGIDVSQ